jgi:hypothetical protein
VGAPRKKKPKHDPNYVCPSCGIRFLTAEQIHRRGMADWVVTMHEGVCCVCGETKGVTHIRHYNHLRKFKKKVR